MQHQSATLARIPNLRHCSTSLQSSVGPTICAHPSTQFRRQCIACWTRPGLLPNVATLSRLGGTQIQQEDEEVLASGVPFGAELTGVVVLASVQVCNACQLCNPVWSPRYVESCAYFLARVGEIIMLNPLEVFNVLDPLSASALHARFSPCRLQCAGPGNSMRDNIANRPSSSRRDPSQSCCPQDSHLWPGSCLAEQSPLFGCFSAVEK